MWIECLQIVATCLDKKARWAAGVCTWHVWPLNGGVVLQLVKENTWMWEKKKKKNQDLVELCYQVLTIFHWPINYICCSISHPINVWLSLKNFLCLTWIYFKCMRRFFFPSVPVKTLFWCLNCPSQACWSVVQLLWDLMVTSRMSSPPVQKPHSHGSCPVCPEAVFDRRSLKWTRWWFL